MASATVVSPVGVQLVNNTFEYPDRPTWATSVLAQGGPWDEINDPLPYSGAPALPMPVEVSDRKSLASFFAHLRNNGSHIPVEGGTTGAEPYYNTELLEFEKGVLYADQRLDLCKMVVGPRSIGDLMDSLKTNTFTKHFLLGNNIIGPVGAAAIAAFVAEKPHQIETWYLAGNCIDAIGFAALVDTMVQSPMITNIWLKRNPLGPTVAPLLFKLVTQSPALRTLDLDQTELGDQCIAEFFNMLVRHAQPVALRHIYLNATGVGPLAAQALSAYLSTPHCKLVSLYLSNNPIGDAVASLAKGVRTSQTLQRLLLQSCGLKDAGTIQLLHAITGHTSLKTLDLAQSYSTKDLGMRYNWLTCAGTIAQVVQADTLQYLNIAYNPLSQTDLLQILPAVLHSTSIVWFKSRPIVQGGRSHAEIKAGQEYARITKQINKHLSDNVAQQYGISYTEFEAGHKRFLLSPEDVRLIDSVYRNRDTGLARRGLRYLQKEWDSDDQTLQRVQDGVMD